MEFDVFNRGEITAINPSLRHCIISISDTVAERAEPAVNSQTLDVLFLAFHDINRPTPGFDLFTDAQADQILNFYERYRSEADHFIAHCNAGQSRSPGVIAALQKIHTGNDNVWFRTRTPNSHVYSSLLSRAFDRGLLTV